MNDFDNRSPHEPSAEFRAALKAELKRAYRAEQQFGVPTSSRRRIAMVIGLAAGGVFTLTVGLVLGAVTGYASAENLNARQREIAAARVDTTPPSGLDLIKMPIRHAITALTCSIAAPQVASTQQRIPMASVTPAVAKTTQTLGAVLGVRELPDGKVLVNDAGRRQIMIFDPTLGNAPVALDSAAGASNSYGPP